MEKTSNGSKPEKKFSTGAIAATVWENQGKSKTGEITSFKTVSFQRRYKDKEGNWKSTNNLRMSDLPRASLVLQKAYEYLVLKEMDGNSSLDSLSELDHAMEEIVM